MMRMLALAATLLAPHAAWPKEAPAFAVQANSIGYLPGHAKFAALAAPARRFVLRRGADGAAVYEAPVTGPFEASDRGERVWRADFTAFDTPGRYYVEVEGLGRSAEFAIDRGVYAASLALQASAFTLWRCGEAVDAEVAGRRWAHAACHLEDGLIDPPAGAVRRDATGGWHDAGDYNKYTVNAGFSLGCLLFAWERDPGPLRGLALPMRRRAAGLPDFLAELKWELDWLMKMQLADGSASHKLSSLRFGPFEMPERDKLPRYFSPASSAATAALAASCAQASRAFEPYDAAYARALRDAAGRAMAWLRAHPQDAPADLSAFKTGAYACPDASYRLWAAAEWWDVSGEPAALAELEGRIRVQGARAEENWDWNAAANLGLARYLACGRDGADPALRAAVAAGFVDAAAAMNQRAARHGWGRALERHYWGANGGVARQALVLRVAQGVSPTAANGDTLVMQLSHLYGVNPYGRSQVTGEGCRPPLHPHHRPSGADGVDDPWPGYLVGGGTTARDWADEQASYRTNEVAINWNAAMVMALAMACDPPALEAGAR